MAWETRQRGGSYYTRSVRQGGRVLREYIGTGETAELIAACDEHDRAARSLARAAERAERDRIGRADMPLADLDALTETLARLALVAAGYHRHHRGDWRRRRATQAAA